MKEKDNKCSVLIPDGESYYLYWVINCLAEIPNILVYIMTNKKDAAIKYSRHVHHTSFYEKTSEIEWISNINTELECYSIDVILPVFEHSIRALSLHRELLLYPEKLGLVPNIEDFDIAVHKWSLAKHLVKNDINHPHCIHAFSGENPEIPGLENMSFPVILKPIEGSGGGVGIRIFEKKQFLMAYLKSIENKREYVVQKVIEGIDFCSNVICQNGIILAHSIQKHTLHGNRKFAPQLGLQYVENLTIYEMTEKLMKSLNWSGVANIDIRYDPENDVYYIIEVNPRYWASVEGSMLAGINFPHLYVKNALGEDIGYTSYNKQEFLNLKGLPARIKSQPLFVFKWKWVWHQTPIKFVFRDSGLSIVRILRKIFPSLPF